MDVQLFFTSRDTALAAGDGPPAVDPQGANEGEVVERIAQMACEVLVVDDDHVFRHELMKRLAKDYRAVVDEADDALVAQQKVGAGFFDVVLLDVELPGEDGFEACQKLREIGRFGRLVLMSSSFRYQDRALALDERFLYKLDWDRFIRSLEDILLHCRDGQIQ